MAASSSTRTLEEIGDLWGHPKGLAILFFTEMWERFSYYGMRGLLVLFLTSTDAAGLGWSQDDALSFYGWYTMFAYLTCIPGGIIADRWLGQRKAITVGGLLLCLGHGIMAVPTLWGFYTGVALIVSGVGMLKPNISTMVGGLYPKGDERRDKGFTVFYMGINLGSLLAGVTVGTIGEVYGWHYGFGLAGIGMFAGQIVFMWGRRYLADVGALPTYRAQTTVQELPPLSAEDKDRVKIILLSFFIVIVFWGAFEQAGGLLNLYTRDYIAREVGGWEIAASAFQSANPAFILIFGLPVATYWAVRKQRGQTSTSLFKMAVGTAIMGSGFLAMTMATLEVEFDANNNVIAKASLFWLLLAYALHTIGELCASPVALSFITKLAPLRYASFMMGAYFAMTGLGNKVAGLLGESALAFGHFEIFTGIAVFCILFGLMIIALRKPFERLTHGAEDRVLPEKS